MAVKGKKDKDKSKKARQKDTTAKSEKQRAKESETDAEGVSAVVAVASASMAKQAKSKDKAAGKPSSKSVSTATRKSPAKTTARTPAAARSGTMDTTILDAALAEAAENGFGSLTTRRIALVAGINEVTIFRRFGSKQALLGALFAREAQRIREVGGQYTGDAEADLLRIASIFTDTSQPARTGAISGVMLGVLGQTMEMRALAGEMALALNELAAVLGRYMADGVLKEEAPMRALGALAGPLLLQSALNATGAEPSLDAGALVDAFLHGRSRGAPQQGSSRSREIRA